MNFQLNEKNPGALTAYLVEKGLLTESQEIKNLEKAGEGNMNLTLRASFDGESLILKQANPFVQKYPSIPAPVERAEMEFSFFKKAEKAEALSSFLPKPIFNDPENHIQVLEDLGNAGDFTRFYTKELNLEKKVIKVLIHFLKNLHQGTRDSEPILNLKMRELNHTHIFNLPFDPENGFDLDGIHNGLNELAVRLIFENESLRVRAKELGKEYLSARGPCLLHGDFFPGSWLKSATGIKIIDPEFCFSGPVEFDLGVFKAHLIFCGVIPSSIDESLKGYGAFDHELTNEFAGIEILRRLFGVAQLPIPYSISEKETLTKLALGLLKL